MFYKRKENNYYYFKSDKDEFFFWRFENIYYKWEFLETDLDIKNLKSYKNLVGIWNNNIYIFEYTNKWLYLVD